MNFRPTEDELRAAVGPNADYYLDRWRDSLDGFPVRHEFNPAACLLAGLWLLATLNRRETAAETAPA